MVEMALYRFKVTRTDSSARPLETGAVEDEGLRRSLTLLYVSLLVSHCHSSALFAPLADTGSVQRGELAHWLLDDSLYA